MLVYGEGAGERRELRMTWLDRAGKAIGTPPSVCLKHVITIIKNGVFEMTADVCDLLRVRGRETEGNLGGRTQSRRRWFPRPSEPPQEVLLSPHPLQSTGPLNLLGTNAFFLR